MNEFIYFGHGLLFRPTLIEITNESKANFIFQETPDDPKLTVT